MRKPTVQVLLSNPGFLRVLHTLLIPAFVDEIISGSEVRKEDVNVEDTDGFVCQVWNSGLPRVLVLPLFELNELDR